MKTYITLALDARHLKKDGTYPVILRVTHFQEVATILTGIYLRKDDWDAERRKVKPSHKGSQSSGRINNYLDKKKADAQERVLKLHDRGLLGGMGVKELKKALEGEDAGGSFFEYAEKLIGLMKERNENGNARTYSFTVGVLRSYVKQRDLFFREISPGFLRGFEHEHFKKGKTANGLSTYLRTIRAIYNKAIAEKVVDRELYPFSEYKIKGTKTAKRAIKGEAILKIQEEILSEDHVLFHARNYFLLSFYFGGMPF
ncbi:MAG: phage integrase SAM-like domain-containing protein, partial [Bacteroidetes bacterium]|nr:phage integrase SAM-like domain-containing protein [Bacteroidota bacterium]